MTQLVKDFEDLKVVNEQLDKMYVQNITCTHAHTYIHITLSYGIILLIIMLIGGRGYNIGVRLVDEFLAKSGVTTCQDFKETAEVVAKVAFKMFLGISVDVSQWNAEGTACSLLLYDNPLTGTGRG